MLIWQFTVDVQLLASLAGRVIKIAIATQKRQIVCHMKATAKERQKTNSMQGEGYS